MNKLELNLPASEWEVEYSQGSCDMEDGDFSWRSVRAMQKNADSDLTIYVVRNDEEGDMLMPYELLQVSNEDALEALKAGIPEYYQTLWGDPIVACTFQGRDAAYFVEQKPGERSAVLNAVVMDEAGWCSFVTVKADDWTSIADPDAILSFLEGYLVL